MYKISIANAHGERKNVSIMKRINKRADPGQQKRVNHHICNHIYYPEKIGIGSS